MRNILKTELQPIRCAYGDPLCPCQDGDPCHYTGRNPMIRVSDPETMAILATVARNIERRAILHTMEGDQAFRELRERTNRKLGQTGRRAIERIRRHAAAAPITLGWRNSPQAFYITGRADG